MQIKIKLVKTVLFDDEDTSDILKYDWFLSPTGYVVAKSNKGMIYMHRLVMKAADKWVDHINGDKADNRKENLRFVDGTQNRANSRKTSGLTSKYKGVRFRKDIQKFHAAVQSNNVRYNLGSFTSEKEAAKAYDLKAKELFGEYALLNFT